MFDKILRKKTVLESLYILRLSSKATLAMLFSSEFYRFFRSVWGHSKSMRAQDSRFLTPAPPLLFVLVCFQATLPSPFQPQGTFVLARTHPLSLYFYTCEVQRKEINNEYQYLRLNSACLLRSHIGISINWTPLVHGKSVHYMEMSALQRVHLKIRTLQQ